MQHSTHVLARPTLSCTRAYRSNWIGSRETRQGHGNSYKSTKSIPDKLVPPILSKERFRTGAVLPLGYTFMTNMQLESTYRTSHARLMK